MEWRVDGKAVGLGLSLDHSFVSVGVHTISVGPPDRAQEILVETYDVNFTSHIPGVDIVPEGEPVTFDAVTDPPGFESFITWIATTKYGTGTPVLGYGPVFTVQFDDTWTELEDGSIFQWLGVKADNAVFGQDQKIIESEDDACAAGASVGGVAYCIYNVKKVQGADCANIVGDSGVVCFECNEVFPGGIGKCPVWVEVRWRHFDCNGNLTCTGISEGFAEGGGIACANCPAADSKKVIHRP